MTSVVYPKPETLNPKPENRHDKSLTWCMPWSAVSKALRAKAGERRNRDAAEDGASRASSVTAAGEDGVSERGGGGASKCGEGRAEEGDADMELKGVGPRDDGDLSDVEMGAGAAQSTKEDRGGGEGRASEEPHEDPEDGDEKIGVSVDYFCCKKCKGRAIETVRILAFCACAPLLDQCNPPPSQTNT